jgi:hypothetical protein
VGGLITKNMKQQDIIDNFKSLNAEIHPDGASLIKSDSNYDYIMNFDSNDCSFNIELWAKDEEIPINIKNSTILALYDYYFWEHSKYVTEIRQIRETQEYLDEYGK